MVEPELEEGVSQRVTHKCQYDSVNVDNTTCNYSNFKTFSTLRRIKSCLRNTTEKKFLNGPASLSIHDRIELTNNEIL